MPLDVPVNTFKNNKLMPVYKPDEADQQAANLAPSTTFGRGTILGQLTAAINDVQTETVTATGGTVRLRLEFPVGNVQTTAAIAYNANAATRQAAIVALSNVGSGNCVVTGTGPYVYTFGGSLAGRPIPVMTVDNTSATGGTSAVAHTTTGATAGTFKTYASGNSDGSQTPKCILPYDVVTDAAGFISFCDTATGGIWGEKTFDIDVWISGAFYTSELVGLDANAVTKMGGLLVSGTIAAGIYKF